MAPTFSRAIIEDAMEFLTTCQEKLHSLGLMDSRGADFTAHQFRRAAKQWWTSMSKEGIRVDSVKIEVICGRARPISVTKIQSFIGLAGYYRCFIEGFSTIAAQLTHLTCEDVPFVWSEECELSFYKLMELLTTAPILTLPVEREIFLLRKHERNYPTHDLELAMVLENMLGACVLDFEDYWEQYLPLAEFVYNNNYHSSV
ncbi:uncharacterized mitochondrial protein AtMg00860-like [Solanum dulcamara]|uniref:uncharacterized mitochondrial protein AtMg00860-like n=1 Tax=Solanum dulcamara TaxID=45834 RepID=UPI0024850141|nr:uncharacterized mitochondrial protein AtMg00860-like [Solanum dulcamara]